MTDIGSRTFYHGTKAELKPGDMLQGGYSSNYTERRSPWIYFSKTVFAAIWGAELPKGEGPGRIYIVEPTGPFMDDPNVTDRKFPGNPICGSCRCACLQARVFHNRDDESSRLAERARLLL
jgi:hypothetical protein